MNIFNINDSMYIQITKEGWEYLEKTVGIDYINISIKSHEITINNEIWYKLPCWTCFDLLPPNFGGNTLFKTEVMFDF